MRLIKAMHMIEARMSLSRINEANFADFEPKVRDNIQRELRDIAERYLFRPLLDYKEVAANLARKLANGRR